MNLFYLKKKICLFIYLFIKENGAINSVKFFLDFDFHLRLKFSLYLISWYFYIFFNQNTAILIIVKIINIIMIINR